MGGTCKRGAGKGKRKKSMQGARWGERGAEGKMWMRERGEVGQVRGTARIWERVRVASHG